MRTALLCIALAALPACKRQTTREAEAPTEAVPANARAKFEQGVVHMEAGAEQYDQAVAAFRAAIAIDAKLWEAWLDIGVIELRRARLGEAAKALEQSLEIYASPEALDALGAVYLRQGKTGRAVGLYERALVKDSGNVRVRNALAAALRHADRLEDAEAECRAILGEHAFDPSAYATLGAIMIDRNQLDLAELLLNKGLSRHPDHPLLVTNLGLVALKRGDDQTALTLFDKASAADPGFVTGRLNKSALFLGAGDHKRAKAELEAVLAIEPGNTEALLGLGIAVRLGGDLGAARASWDRVLAIDADHPAAHFNLGVLDMDFAEQPASAKKHLERYLQVVGNDGDKAADAKERLALLEALATPGGKAK
jgi:tetratricopeptide (TPR) repeat protein